MSVMIVVSVVLVLVRLFTLGVGRGDYCGNCVGDDCGVCGAYVSYVIYGGG